MATLTTLTATEQDALVGALDLRPEAKRAAVDALLHPLLVFVEVRYRRDASFGGGAASIDARKRRKLITAARLYLATHPAWRDLACRFDVVDAHGDPDHPVLDWIRDAFRTDDA